MNDAEADATLAEGTDVAVGPLRDSPGRGGVDAPLPGAAISDPGALAAALETAAARPRTGVLAGEASVVPTAGAGPLQFDEALAVARRLAGVIVAPSDCGSVPPEDPFLLPNAARAYRSGVHRGVDYMCAEHGRVAVAALDGRVVVAVGDYETPSPSQRDTLLAIAAQRGATPPFTLLMLYGNYVVVDHGHVDDVGHVVTIYAHLASLTAGISTGTAVRAGDELGRIGNTGTEHDAAGAADRGVHLHWEIHINDHHLAAGLSLAETRTIYTTLFNNPTNT